MKSFALIYSGLGSDDAQTFLLMSCSQRTKFIVLNADLREADLATLGAAIILKAAYELDTATAQRFFGRVLSITCLAVLIFDY